MSSEEHAVESEESGPDPIPHEKPFFSRAGGKIFIIWLLMTAVGVLIGVYAPSHLLPTMVSAEGHTVVITIVLFTVLAAPVAAFVYAVGVYSLLGWRHKGSDTDAPPPDGPPMRGNGPMTVLWLSLSAILVVVLLVWGLSEFTAEQTSHPNTLQVNVTGQQWLWTFSYPGTGVQSRSLVLPVNRPVQFNVTSLDVTHGFWPASLGVQVDANPNVVTVITATPNKLGGFTVRCSQLCGLYHAFMYAPGSVVTPQAFAAWLHTQGASVVQAASTARVSAVVVSS
jgi:cytochrome c oxidase subunit 2